MNINELIPIEYKGRKIRMFTIDGKLWFSLSDVCAVLGLGNPGMVKTRLKQCGVNLIRATYDSSVVRKSKARKTQIITIINEPNLYRVIFRSDKREAEPFTDWVTEEVLPSIREKGYYGTQSAIQHDDSMVADGYFSVINETYRVVYLYMEHLGFIIPDKHKAKDKFIHLDINIERLFKKWMEQCHPEELKRNKAKTYRHNTEYGFLEGAKQYPVALQERFDWYVLNEWMINIAPGYSKERLVNDQRRRQLRERG